MINFSRATRKNRSRETHVDLHENESVPILHISNTRPVAVVEDGDEDVAVWVKKVNDSLVDYNDGSLIDMDTVKYFASTVSVNEPGSKLGDEVIKIHKICDTFEEAEEASRKLYGALRVARNINSSTLRNDPESLHITHVNLQNGNPVKLAIFTSANDQMAGMTALNTEIRKTRDRMVENGEVLGVDNVFLLEGVESARLRPFVSNRNNIITEVQAKFKDDRLSSLTDDGYIRVGQLAQISNICSVFPSIEDAEDFCANLEVNFAAFTRSERARFGRTPNINSTVVAHVKMKQ